MACRLNSNAELAVHEVPGEASALNVRLIDDKRSARGTSARLLAVGHLEAAHKVMWLVLRRAKVNPLHQQSEVGGGVGWIYEGSSVACHVALGRCLGQDDERHHPRVSGDALGALDGDALAALEGAPNETSLVIILPL